MVNFTKLFNKITKLTIITIVIFTITIVMIEIVGRKIINDEMLMFVNDVDHRMKPNSKKCINRDGIRSHRDYNDFSDSDYNIIFLGDSFVYGLLLENEESIPYKLEKILREKINKNINVINFGWVSSSPLLSYRLLLDIGEKYKPDMVILGVDMTDFSDDIKYEKLLGREGIYKICDYLPAAFITIHKIIANIDMLSGLHEYIFKFPSKRFFVTEQPLDKSANHIKYIQKNIDKINDYCTSKLKSKFVLTLFPRGYQYSTKESPMNWEKKDYEIMGKYSLEPFNYFDQKKESLGYQYFSLLHAFKNTTLFPTCFDHDPHYNENGATVAADAVANFLLKNKMIDSNNNK